MSVRPDRAGWSADAVHQFDSRPLAPAPRRVTNHIQERWTERVVASDADLPGWTTDVPPEWAVRRAWRRSIPVGYHGDGMRLCPIANAAIVYVRRTDAAVLVTVYNARDAYRRGHIQLDHLVECGECGRPADPSTGQACPWCQASLASAAGFDPEDLPDASEVIY